MQFKLALMPVLLAENLAFASNGGWGALELVARVQGPHIDDDSFPVLADPSKSSNSAFGLGVGANWHLNRNLKLSLDYENIHFTGGEENPITANNEQMTFTRVQVSF